VFGYLEGLLLAASAKLCCPRQFDSSDWFVCARGSVRWRGNVLVQEGGTKNEEDKQAEVNIIAYDERKIGRRTIQQKK
jgi:hypothetical protein